MNVDFVARSTKSSVELERIFLEKKVIELFEKPITGIGANCFEFLAQKGNLPTTTKKIDRFFFFPTLSD